MSGQDVYQSIGATFGIISVLWMIASQMFGTFAERTVRSIVERQTGDMVKLMERLESLAKSGRGND